MKVFIEKAGVILKRSLGFILLLSISGTSVALATFTFTGTTVTLDSFMGILSGVVGIGATSTSAMLYVQAQNVATTTLQLQGLAGQTARLFAVASSSGVNNFEILASGVASSTDFIAVNASATNINASGYLVVSATSTLGTTTVTGFTYGTASGTSLSASSYLNTPTLVASNVSSTNVSSTNVTFSGLSVLSGTSTFGGGSQIAKIFCGHTYATLTALAANATGTIGISLTGISTSVAQSFQMGSNATSGYAYNIQLMNVVPSSTANTADLVLRNIGSAALPTEKALFTVCGTQK